MTREIKFRAWDGENMHYWNSITHKETKEIAGTPYPKLFYLPMSYLVGDNNDWVWQQYTGLKDKNGKEIYEGDIVYHVEEVVVEVISGHERREPEGFFTEVKIPDIYLQVGGDLPDTDELEIIGNIYENPELIK